MARRARRARIYLLILLVAVLVALLVPYITRTFSDYFRRGPNYYSPHDLEREQYMKGKEKR